jgi:hypothetical protein
VRIDEARGLWEPAGVYVNTASYGLPPRPAWDALQAALADWHGGRTSWEHWGEAAEDARASFGRLIGVPAERVALWYYWRWRVESYFKLLKGAGLHLERWQQETALAVAKRLLVASMACVVVWQVARSQAPEAAEVRRLLVRLSGRQMKWGVEFTEPALLSGLWVLLALVKVLGHHDLGDLLRQAQAALPTSDPPDPPLQGPV